jgi:uncharacterized repeat protein (TIGR01451 family)
MKVRILLSTLLVIVLLSSLLAPVAAVQGPTTAADSGVQEERKPETKETVGEYVAPTRAGVRDYEHEYEWVGSQGIPDGACPDMTTILLNVPDSFTIYDVRVGFNALHTFRADIELWLMSPQGTLVNLFLNQDEGADNFDVLFEDGGGPVDSTNHNIDPPYYEYSWMPWSPLAAFVGEDALGNWELRICDQYDLDTGSVERWALFFNRILSPDLSESTKEVWPATAEPGDVLTYTVHISNTGDAPAWQAVMADAIPDGTAYVTDSVDCSWGDCWYDADDDAVYWHQGEPPDYRYFVASQDDANTVWEIDLIKTDVWWTPDTWGVIDTCTVAGIADNVGIDYDAEHGVLYHSDFYTDTIVVTDLDCNVRGYFACASLSGFNTGVTYVEGSQPPEVWVTDYDSETTTRCEALLQPGAPAAPAPVALPGTEVTSLRELNYSGPGLVAPGDPIEQFPNTWAPDAIGLVYDPSRDWVRYAHESDYLGEGNPTIFDVDWPLPHPLLGQCALSAVNPGWDATLNNRSGAGYDFESDTYFLPDYQGNEATYDDNIVEIDPQCDILNAWETDGIDNDSYDGSVIDRIVDIAVVPNPPPFEEFVVTFQVEVDVPCVDTIVNEAVITDPEEPDEVTVQAETLIDCAGPDITVDPPSLHSDQYPDVQVTLGLSICNVGDQPLEWGITEVPVDISWLSEDPITGVVLLDECQVVDVTFDATGLAPGDYDGDLAIVSNDPDTPTTTLPISLTVLEPLFYYYLPIYLWNY